MFTYTPLLGAQSASPASQSLLQLDGGVKILVDLGWDDDFDPEKLKEIEKHVPTLSIILLTHATSAHLAAFAHCCKHFPLFTRIPIYATTPVISLGRTFLQDLYDSTPLASTIIPKTSLSRGAHSDTVSLVSGSGAEILLPSPTSAEIATYFALIHPLKYSQPHQPLGAPFSPPLNGLTITAFSAGHTLGGTIWHIQHGLESIVYAVDWNQAREHVLSGAAWLGGAGASGAEVVEQLRKPTALICSSRGAERIALSGGRNKRDELLLEMIRSTVAKGGVVLIPTDSSARVLELAYLLEHAWRTECSAQSEIESVLRKTKLYLASKNIGATMRYARSMFEWMDEGIVRELEAVNAGDNRQSNRSGGGRRGGPAQDGKDNHGGSNPTGPFDFKHLKLLERKKQIDRVLDEALAGTRKVGQVILASDASLEWGFSKEVIRRIASDSRSLVILTERRSDASLTSDDEQPRLASRLWKMWQDRAEGVAMEPGSDGQNLEQVFGGGREVCLSDIKAVPLDTNETVVYQQYLATQRKLNNNLLGADQAALNSAADAADDDSSSSSSSDDDSDSERQGKALNVAATLAHTNRNKVDLTDEELGVSILLRRSGTHDYDVRGRKGREKMFPFVVKRRRGDDFGEFIRPEDFLKAEERDDIDGQDMRAAGKDGSGLALGQKRKWEEMGRPGPHGLTIPIGAVKRRQTGNGQYANGGELDADDLADMKPDEATVSDDEPDDPVVIGPMKLVRSTESVRFNMRIAYVDVAGLHDRRSLQMLIPLIEPRKLILVSGAESETLALAADCRRVLSAKAGGADDDAAVGVFTPAVGVTIDASVDTNAWLLTLSEPLVKALHWQTVRGLGVVHVTGLLAAATMTEEEREAGRESHKKQKVIANAGQVPKEEVVEASIVDAIDTPPMLDVIPVSLAATTRSIAQPLHVGDFRLADLRKILQGSGHNAEFRGEGSLLIDGLVVVKKTGVGRIEIEGGGLLQTDIYSRQAGEGSFYAVKRKIYEGLAIVAGGQ